jgi:hypothetical protein
MRPQSMKWLYDSNLSLDPEELNPRLSEWLTEYDFNRPHQSLAYLAPRQYKKGTCQNPQSSVTHVVSQHKLLTTARIMLE